MENIDRLNEQFGIAGRAQVVEGNGGLPKVLISSLTCQGEIYLHGAHLTSWRPAHSQEAIFLSEQATWKDGSAIRGGVPICFPWFRGKRDDPRAPAHGVARTRSWDLVSITQAGDDVTVKLRLDSDRNTKELWPFDFQLAYSVTFGERLGLALRVKNTGGVAFQFEEALHTYYRVGDVHTIRITGLENREYLDKIDPVRRQAEQAALVIGEETDRIYLETADAVEVTDPTLGRVIRTEKQNSQTTVIWNPWRIKAEAMRDLGDGEWQQMICVEGSNVRPLVVELLPGQEHVMSVEATIEAIGRTTKL